jgi:hypothetical protein
MNFPRLLAIAVVSTAAAQTGDVVLHIPPTKASFDAGGHPVTVTVWGSLSRASADVFRLALTADLDDLQQNVTPLLRSQLDRSDRCGERLSVEQAVLVPAAPDSLLSATVHYERWGCMKAFGKETVRRLVGGNATLKVKLTPLVETNAVSLKPEVVGIEADGSLGELLRSKSVGDALKEKIASSVRAAIEKATNFSNVLPPEIGSAATIRSVEFITGQGGRLCIESIAEVRISPDSLKALGKQLDSR